MFWYVNCFRKYAVFSGRARRTEYWMFVLINTLIMIALLLPMAVFAASLDSENSAATSSDANPIIVALFFIFFSVYLLYLLAMFIPMLAVTVRRLHDTGRSGWWYLLNFVPLGNWVLFVFFCLDSEQGDNDYGANPKGDGAYWSA